MGTDGGVVAESELERAAAQVEVAAGSSSTVGGSQAAAQLEAAKESNSTIIIGGSEAPTQLEGSAQGQQHWKCRLAVTC